MLRIEFKPTVAEMINQLDGLEDALRVKAIRSGLIAAVGPVKKAMKASVPVGSGRLRSSISHRSLSKRQMTRVASGDEVGLLVGPTKKVAGPNGKKRQMGWLANILEEGAKPHRIQARKGGVLRVGRHGIARMVEHPGVKPRHWMRNAYESSQHGLERRFYQGLKKYLEQKGVPTA